jgi:NAD-dependent SIR2 family protein deacetylase
VIHLIMSAALRRRIRASRCDLCDRSTPREHQAAKESIMSISVCASCGRILSTLGLG